jgi:hypothetical protein
MDLLALIERVRNHYVDQFEIFVERQEQDATRGHAEVKFLIPEPTALHRRFACIDFVKNDDGVEAVLFEPEHVLQFAPFSGVFGRMTLGVEALRWDVVAVHHDLPVAPQLDKWFQRWFDPEDERHDPSARLGGIIHSLNVIPGVVSIDFGSAPAEALWQLLEHFDMAGAKRLTINSQAPTIS